MVAIKYSYLYLSGPKSGTDSGHAIPVWFKLAFEHNQAAEINLVLG